MISLPGLLAAKQMTDGGFRTEIPPEWQQGRTAYGGFSAALAYEAARGAADDLPPLRSAQISFVGPLSGTVEITAKLLRRGKNAAFIQADVVGEAGIGLTGTFVFMREMESTVHLAADAPPPDHPRPAAAEVPQGVGPAFVGMFDMGVMETGADGRPADIVRWIRLKDRQHLDPMTELLAIGDALPPAALPLMTKVAPVSSLTWMFNALTPNPVSADGWWLLRSTSDHIEHGNTSQDMSMWNADGTLVVRAMQSIALFG
jgi:acyl-CoA thioesterase|tara:strand:- start:13204 stop:13980 length:777 start_codon:yes stop_codon:yes gene_type:complete